MRINLYGGPGVGKSTLAAAIFAGLRQRGQACALVTEWIKQWAYEGRQQRGFDSFYAFASQLHLEEESLRHVGCIVSDSPIYLQCMYADKNCPQISHAMWNIACEYEHTYPSHNIYVQRTGEYEQRGRWESEDEARRMDDYILDKLTTWCVPHTVYTRDDATRICNELSGLLNPPLLF